MAFLMKRGDTLPNIPFALFMPDGTTPLDLTGAQVMLCVRNKTTKVLLWKKACTVPVPASGTGYYDWSTGDTDTAGNYDYEFEVTDSSGNVITIPVDGYYDLIIFEDVR